MFILGIVLNTYFPVLCRKRYIMPSTTAGAILINEDNKVLLTRRNITPFKDYWCLPGGHIDEFETAEQAAIREVKEETGLDFDPQFLCYMDEIFRELKVHKVVIMFYGHAKGTVETDPVEVSGAGWYSFKEALSLDLAFEHRKVLELYLEKKKSE